jgi:3-phenylpropionate/trans-cinnamate dioxygenase ferredoxin reductase subunit
MNVNVWDVQEDVQALVRAGYEGRSVDLGRLADPEVPLGDVVR